MASQGISVQKTVSENNELCWSPGKQTCYLVSVSKYAVIELNIWNFKSNVKIVLIGKIRLLLGFLRLISLVDIVFTLNAAVEVFP